jgi:hypothetical protein
MSTATNSYMDTYRVSVKLNTSKMLDIEHYAWHVTAMRRGRSDIVSVHVRDYSAFKAQLFVVKDSIMLLLYFHSTRYTTEDGKRPWLPIVRWVVQ